MILADLKVDFSVIVVTSRSHVFTKCINHASNRRQYCNANFLLLKWFANVLL